jgi:hypothetical protein
MDVATIAASLVSAQAGALQQQIATRVMKMNIDSEASVLQLLQPAQTKADPGAGVGGRLDMSV